MYIQFMDCSLCLVFINHKTKDLNVHFKKKFLNVRTQTFQTFKFSFAQLAWGVLVDTKLNMSQQHALAGKKEMLCATLGVLQGEGGSPFTLPSTGKATPGIPGPVAGSPVQGTCGPREFIDFLHGNGGTWRNLAIVGHVWMQLLVWQCWLKSALNCMTDQLPRWQKAKWETYKPFYM